MQTRYKLLTLLAFCCIPASLFAAPKDNKFKFSSILPADFDVKQNMDSEAGAVVIADVGESYFSGNSKGWFSVMFKKQERIKVVNKNGFDAANIKIPIYIGKDGNEERIENLKATTYNLENGQVVSLKLEKSEIFRDKFDKHHIVEKFTFPGVKAGSIIEYSYTLSSDFLFNLQPWEFQCEYPTLYTSYNVEIPEFFRYVFLRQGAQKLDGEQMVSNVRQYNIAAQRSVNTGYGYSNGAGAGLEFINVSSNTTIHAWNMKNVAPMKEEMFTSTIDNYISKISFQLSAIALPERPVEPIMGDWKMACKEMLNQSDFGEDLNKGNHWMMKELQTVIGTENTDMEITRKIYAYLRDNFTATHKTGAQLTQPLEETFSKKSGSVADLNLLLVSMLRHARVHADPVLLSTREHGHTLEVYPIINRFNYVICRVKVNGKDIFLDASQPDCGFARLPLDCYNGHARIVDSISPLPVYFNPDTLEQKKLTMVTISRDEKNPEKMVGTYSFNPGYYKSLEIRKEVKKEGKESYFKKQKAAFLFDASITNPAIDNVGNKDEAVKVSYNFSFDAPTEGMFYLNPMLMNAIKQNYFASAERKYPVEMNSKMDETYLFDMEIPAGYVIEEMPKGAKVTFNGDDGYFEYLFELAQGHIKIRTRLKMNKAIIQPEDYEQLRNFFGFVVNKHAEQIVFKKRA